MDLRSLNTFIQVAELSNFTRAAEKLGYAQPTISFQIRQLEEELGIRLFERVGHTVKLTDDGRDALEYAQRICRMTEEMTMGPDRRSVAEGVIRLAMADSLCMPLIERGFADFRRRYPKVRLHVVTAGTGDMFRLLDHNEADLVCTLDSHIYNTNYVIAGEEKIGVHFIASKDHPLASGKAGIRDLLDQPFILTEKGMSYNRLLEEKLARDSLEIQPVLEIGNADMICRLVAENMGLSFLPDYVTESAVCSGEIVRLDVPGFEIDLWKQLLYHRGKWMSLQLQAAIDHLSGIALADSRRY